MLTLVLMFSLLSKKKENASLEFSQNFANVLYKYK